MTSDEHASIVHELNRAIAALDTAATAFRRAGMLLPWPSGRTFELRAGDVASQARWAAAIRAGYRVAAPDDAA